MSVDSPGKSDGSSATFGGPQQYSERDLTTWSPTTGLRPNVLLSRTRMFNGGAYSEHSFSGKSWNKNSLVNQNLNGKNAYLT